MTTTSNKLQSALTSAESGIRELFTFVRFCEASLRLAPLITRMPSMIDFLFRGGVPPAAAHMRESLEDEIKVIQIGVEGRESYESYLHGVAMIKACSVLESAVDDVAVALLSDREYWPKLDGLAKLRANKVDLVGLLQMTHTQQTNYLLSEIKKETAASYQTGAGRYESILNFVGMGGNVPEIASRSLLELLETRHLLVHRNGVADSKFVNKCPWKAAEIGTKIEIKRLDFSITSMAATWYLLEMQLRASKIFPDCKFEHDDGFADKILGDISEYHQLRDAPPKAKDDEDVEQSNS